MNNSEKKKTYVVEAIDIDGNVHKVEMEAHDDQFMYEPCKFYFSPDQEGDLKSIINDSWVVDMTQKNDNKVTINPASGWTVTVCYEGECHCGLKDENNSNS
jgi:hypothetical protein